MKVLAKIAIVTIVCLSCMTGCGFSQKKEVQNEEYDLNQSEKYALPAILSEVSGIVLHEGIPDTVYAIQDEDGILFRLAWNQRKDERIRFSGKGDYEDLAILNDRVIVLKSNGTLYSFPFSKINMEKVKAEKTENRLSKGEYEALFGDPQSGLLYVLCKNCRRDEDTKRVSGFVLSPDDDFKEVRKFSIDEKEIEAFEGKLKRAFQPSALARNPVSGKWYILSSVNRLLVVADSNWRVSATLRLKGRDFVQPEGIAFDRAGTLYISNEGSGLTGGTILRFVRKN